MLTPSPGRPEVRGRIRSQADDFEVDEVLGFEADGAGAHVLLKVEKSGANTPWVASQLARCAGVHVRDVGFCGLKDRHALTRQSFSIPLRPDLDPATCLEYRGDGYRVLSAARHARKLRRGSHRGNRFRIVVRDLAGDTGSLEPRLQRIARDGVPNYFGMQRFGRDAANLVRAQSWAADGAAPADRSQRTFALSAARSHLFNKVLAERVLRNDWNRLLPGEAVALDGSGSFFSAPVIDSALQTRSDAFDVHPSAPLCGSGASPATSEALEVEESALASEQSLRTFLERQGLRHERRATRLAVRALTWRIDGDLLELAFELQRGAFATAVLNELITTDAAAPGGVVE